MGVDGHSCRSGPLRDRGCRARSASHCWCWCWTVVETSPVHVLEALGVTFFVALAAVGLAASRAAENLAGDVVGEITNATLAIFALVSPLTGRPHTTAYARDVTPPDHWDTPLFKRTNMVVTAVWGGGLRLLCLGRLPRGRGLWPYRQFLDRLHSAAGCTVLSRWPSPSSIPNTPGPKRRPIRCHPVPSWSRVFEWPPPFVLATGVAGWLLATVSSGVAADLVVPGAFGTALLRRRELAGAARSRARAALWTCWTSGRN